MRRRIVVTLAVLAISAIGIAGCKKQEQQTEAPATTTAPATPPASVAPTEPAPSATGLTGEALYKQHCAACHPDGGNAMNAKKTLHAGDMAANKITTSDDIVKVMRNPPKGMTKFDESVISDRDAKTLADYILATYK